MHSTITNYTANIDVAFPIAGQSNDPQGFRDNFYNIREALNWAAIEINTLSQNIHPIVHTNIVIDNSQPKLALSPTGVQPDDGAVLFDNQDALIEISPTFNGKSIMNISNAQDISLNNQKLVGSVYLGHTAPGSLSGQIGDQKGQMVLGPLGSYIATQDYSGPANVISVWSTYTGIWSTSTPYKPTLLSWTTSTPWIPSYWTTSTPFINTLSNWTTSTPWIWTTSTPLINLIKNGNSWTKLSTNIESNKMVVVKPSQLYSPTSPTPNIICDLSLGTRFFINHPGTDLAINFINLPPSPCQVEAFVTIKTGPDRNNVIQQIFIEGGAAQVVMNSKIGTFKDNAGNPLTYNPDTPGWGYKRWITIVSPKPNDYTVFSVEGVFLGPRITYSGVSGQSLVYTPPTQGARYAPGSSVPSEGPLTINGIADGGRLNLPQSAIGNAYSETFTLGGTQYDPTVPYNISHSGTLPTGTTIAVGQNGATLQGSLLGAPNTYSFTITAAPQYNPNNISCTITVNMAITSVPLPATSSIPGSTSPPTTDPKSAPTVTIEAVNLGINTVDPNTKRSTLLTDSSGKIAGGYDTDLAQGDTVYPDTYVYFQAHTKNATHYKGSDGTISICGPNGAGLGWFYVKDLVGESYIGPFTFSTTFYNVASSGGVLDTALSTDGTFKLVVADAYYKNYGNPNVLIENSSILTHHTIIAKIEAGNPNQTWTLTGAPFDQGSYISGRLDSSGNGQVNINIITTGSYTLNFSFDQPGGQTTAKTFAIVATDSSDYPSTFTATANPDGRINIDVQSIVAVNVTFDKPIKDHWVIFDIGATFTYDTPYFNTVTNQTVTSIDLNPSGHVDQYYYHGNEIHVYPGQTSCSNTFNLSGIRGPGTISFTCSLEPQGVDLGLIFIANGGYPLTGSPPDSIQVTSTSNFETNSDTTDANRNIALEQAIANGTATPAGLDLGSPIDGLYNVRYIYTDSHGGVAVTDTSPLFTLTQGVPANGVVGTWKWSYDGKVLTSTPSTIRTNNVITNTGGTASSQTPPDPNSYAQNTKISTTFQKGNSLGTAGNILDPGTVVDIGIAGDWSSKNANKPITYNIIAPDGTSYPGTGITDANGGFTLTGQSTTTPGAYTYQFTLPDGSIISQDYIVRNSDGSIPSGTKTLNSGVIVADRSNSSQTSGATGIQTPSNQTGSVVGGASGSTTISTPAVHDIPVARPAVPVVPPQSSDNSNIVTAPSEVTAGQLFNASLNAGAAYANQTVTVTVTNPDGTETTSQETLDANGSIQYTGASIGQPGQYKYKWTAANGASVSTNLNVTAPPTSSTPDSSAVDNSGDTTYGD